MSEKKNEIGTGSVLVGGAGFLALVGFGLLLALGMYLYARGRTSRPGEPPPTFVATGILPPEPRLQADPHDDLRRLRAAEDSVLSSYAWVNRDSGLVRIPVNRALAIIAERGLPLRESRTEVLHRRRGP